MKSYIVLLLIAVSSSIKINKYDGPLPEEYDATKGGDVFMNKALRQYGEHDGKHFVFSRDSVLALSTDVMENNQGMRPCDAKAHIGAEFDKAWNHFDNLNEGKIHADQLENFYRLMTRNATMQFEGQY